MPHGDRCEPGEAAAWLGHLGPLLRRHERRLNMNFAYIVTEYGIHGDQVATRSGDTSADWVSSPGFDGELVSWFSGVR